MVDLTIGELLDNSFYYISLFDMMTLYHLTNQYKDKIVY